MAEPQVAAVRDLLVRVLGDDLVGLWLHGSAVTGGLRPGSDLDLLAVVAYPLTGPARHNLRDELLTISAPCPAQPGGPRCIELAIRLAGDPPARCDFLYGEWLRDGFAAGGLPQPVADPDLIPMLAQARRTALPLIGPPAETLLPEISPADLRVAMKQALPALTAGIEDDTRNVLLTLARMWRTAVEGDFVPKDAAADWAIARLSGRSAAVLADARDAYLTGQPIGAGTAAGRAASEIAQHLSALL